MDVRSYKTGQDMKLTNKGYNESGRKDSTIKEVKVVRACEEKRGSTKHYVGRRAMEMEVQVMRKRGKRKRRWLDRVRDDIRVLREEVYDRATWRRISSDIDPT